MVLTVATLIGLFQIICIKEITLVTRVIAITHTVDALCLAANWVQTPFIDLLAPHSPQSSCWADSYYVNLHQTLVIFRTTVCSVWVQKLHINVNSASTVQNLVVPLSSIWEGCSVLILNEPKNRKTVKVWYLQTTGVAVGQDTLGQHPPARLCQCWCDNQSENWVHLLLGSCSGMKWWERCDFLLCSE